MKITNNHLLGFVITAVLISMLFLVSGRSGENLRLVSGHVYDLNNGWTILSEGKVIEDVQLPYKIDLKVNEVYKAEKILDSDFEETFFLKVRSSMQNIIVYLDGMEVYRDIKPESSSVETADASVWHMIELPADADGKLLQLVMTSPVKEFSGMVNAISYGKGSDLLYNLVSANVFTIILGITLLAIGLASVPIAYHMRLVSDYRLVYLGMLSFSIGLWILSEGRIMQLFTSKRYVIGSISYVMIAVAPISFLLYVKEVYLKKYERLLFAIIDIYMALLFLMLVMQAIGKSSFLGFAYYLNGWTGLTAAVVIFATIREAFFYGNSAAKKHLAVISAFLLFIMIAIISFFNHDYDHIAIWINFSIIIMAVFMVVESVRYVNELELQQQKLIIYKGLAYKDILTNGLNRIAFDRDIEALTEKKQRTAFRLVLSDLNGLKGINDRYGHNEGSQAIISCYRNMKEVFGDIGSCYRLGGDEFAMIVNEIDEEAYIMRKEKLRKKLLEEQYQYPYKIEMAMGSGVYEYDYLKSFTDFYKEIDDLMYKEKRRMKNLDGC